MHPQETKKVLKEIIRDLRKSHDFFTHEDIVIIHTYSHAIANKTEQMLRDSIRR